MTSSVEVKIKDYGNHMSQQTRDELTTLLTTTPWDAAEMFIKVKVQRGLTSEEKEKRRLHAFQTKVISTVFMLLVYIWIGAGFLIFWIIVIAKIVGVFG